MSSTICGVRRVMFALALRRCRRGWFSGRPSSHRAGGRGCWSPGSRLPGLEGNPHQKPGQTVCAHLPPDRLLDDRLQEHRMLDVQLLVDCLAPGAPRRWLRRLTPSCFGDPIGLRLDLRASTQIVQGVSRFLLVAFCDRARELSDPRALAGYSGAAQAGSRRRERLKKRSYLALHHAAVVCSIARFGGFVKTSCTICWCPLFIGYLLDMVIFSIYQTSLSFCKQSERSWSCY